MDEGSQRKSADRELDVDRLRTGTVEVIPLEGMSIGDEGVRAPHRHDYHELIWIREGSGEHVIDGMRVAAEPETVTIIGRGQVHQFSEARELHGAVLRFTNEVLLGGAARIAAGWLLSGRGGRTIPIPRGECSSMQAVMTALAAESARPPDPYSDDVQRQLISTVVLWLERWFDAVQIEARDPDDADMRLHRRFVERLEADFAAHHDAAHYAEALGVPAATLSKALASLTGRTTKEAITDRVMLEASRLLRFSDLSIGEVAHRAGFADQLYFSRAFKRYTGLAPQAFRAAVRGQAQGD